MEPERKANDSGVFIEFVLSVLLDTVKVQAKHQAENVPSNARIMSEDFNEADMRKVKPILDCFEAHNSITPHEAQKTTEKSAATDRRYFALLCELGMVESTGNTGSKVYKVKMQANGVKSDLSGRKSIGSTN